MRISIEMLERVLSLIERGMEGQRKRHCMFEAMPFGDSARKREN
jgi:hypothetical protein